MKNELYHYLPTPSVFPVGKEVVIGVRAQEPRYVFADRDDYRVEILPLSFRHDMIDRLPEITVPAKAEGGVLRFTYTFPREDEYYLVLYAGDNRLEKLSVYALEADLYRLRPLKGDTHVHSCRSDGKDTPSIVAANYRAAGFDFMGLTDHHRFDPSVEAIDAYKGLRLGMTQMTGEEVHSPDTYLHIVHFGGKYSVNRVFEDDRDKFMREVAEIDRQSGTAIPFTDGRSRFVYASALWCVREIHRAEGIAVFPHPFWIWTVYNVPPELTRQFLLNDVFDAFELIGGQSANENNYQTQFYYSVKEEYLETKGKRMTLPVLGASDSHGTVNSGLFDKKYSVVFAESRKPEDILTAIRKSLCTAVEVYEDSRNYTVHGSYRLMAYTRFLCENYFPLTRKLAAVDGALMREYAMGSKEAGTLLDLRNDTTDRFYREYFGR